MPDPVTGNDRSMVKLESGVLVPLDATLRGHAEEGYITGLPGRPWQETYISRKRATAQRLFPSDQDLSPLGFLCDTRHHRLVTSRASEAVWLRAGLDFEYVLYRMLVALGFAPGVDVDHPGSLAPSRRRPDFAFPSRGVILEAKIIPQAITYSPDQIGDYVRLGDHVALVTMTDSLFRWEDPELSVFSIEYFRAKLPPAERPWFDCRIERIASLELLDDITRFREGRIAEKANDEQGALSAYESAISGGSRHVKTFERASVILGRRRDRDGHRWLVKRSRAALDDVEIERAGILKREERLQR